MNLNGVEYYYERNAQDDIIGLIDDSGNLVVTYVYDSWGKLVSINGTLKDTVGVKNPYRYRGYRYDNETGLYYLQSRYYNPEWGRFINADVLFGQYGELLSHNLYAYCRNNPVMLIDPSGKGWYISNSKLQTAIKVAIFASAINPTPAVIISIGVYKVYKLIVAGSTALAARLGAVGGIFFAGAAAIIGYGILKEFGWLILDALIQGKGINIDFKRTRSGIAYGVDIQIQ